MKATNRIAKLLKKAKVEDTDNLQMELEKAPQKLRQGKIMDPPS